METALTDTSEYFEVEVAYALPDKQTVRRVRVPRGATLEQAITCSGLLSDYPHIQLAMQKTGIFGKLKPLDAPLHPNDRVEIYRPLLIDPKEARRQRAKDNRRK